MKSIVLPYSKFEFEDTKFLSIFMFSRIPFENESSIIFQPFLKGNESPSYAPGFLS